MTYVSKQMSVDQINCLATFRRDGKFPTVTYVHPDENGSVGQGCCVWRSSEPVYSLLLQDCPEDKLNFIEMAKFGKENIKLINVFTLRPEPFNNSSQNQKTYGFESLASYPNIVRNSYGLDY